MQGHYRSLYHLDELEQIADSVSRRIAGVSLNFDLAELCDGSWTIINLLGVAISIECQSSSTGAFAVITELLFVNYLWG